MYKILTFCAGLTLSAWAWGGDNRPDVDLDDDGLIEINSLEDLNNVRRHLDGKALYTSSEGCPNTGCIGFELTKTLDFDSNGDGQFNAKDSFWNGGIGFIPLGLSETTEADNKPFTAVFEGNGFKIQNLVIQQQDKKNIGLFSRTQGAYIRNLGITGPITHVVGWGAVGGVVGYAINTKMEGIYVFGHIEGRSAQGEGIGGVMGVAIKSSLYIAHSTATVSAPADKMGGIVGFAEFTELTAVLAEGKILQLNLSEAEAAKKSIGALSGYGGTFIDSYWLKDAVGIHQAGVNVVGGEGIDLAELLCPDIKGFTSCLKGIALYQYRPDYHLLEVQPYWEHFERDRPILYLTSSKRYTDNDNDGYFFEDDDNDFDPAYSQDSDDDGAPDFWNLGCDSACQKASGRIIDAFPQDNRVTVDANGNGKPDAWNLRCDVICQQSSGWVVDEPDFDADGVIDQVDTDDNNDGQWDADSDSDGLIDIRTVSELAAISFDMRGNGRKLSAEGLVDVSGCPLKYFQNAIKPICQGYELMNDVDFDTNQNGLFDSGDINWNNGAGWQGIVGHFNTIFEGNGYAIRHLTIPAPNGGVGLFQALDYAEIRNLAILDFNGKNSSVLASYGNDSKITGLFIQGTMQGCNGVLGSAASINIKNIVSDVNSTCKNVFDYGAFVPYLYSSNVSSILSLGRLQQFNQSAGSIGSASDSNITNSYWAMDTVGVEKAVAASGPNNVLSNLEGASLAQLSCPTSANNTSCLPGKTLYQDWDKELNSQGQAYWRFFAEGGLPALVLNGHVYQAKPKLLPVNKAPTIKVEFEQRGKIRPSMDILSEFTLRALVSDENKDDFHQVSWKIKGYSTESIAASSFKLNLKVGKYPYEVTVVDSGVPSLTTKISGVLVVTAEPELVPSSPGGTTPAPKAGAFNSWYLLLMLSLMGFRFKLNKK